jgi:cytoplasmic iron level regulating protein YaaA (DUF328/UPF0246 family)
MSVMQRYTWVMFKAIGYELFDAHSKAVFDQSVLILSGMYWILNPTDQIANYKLPIWTKGLMQFWWDTLTKELNLLPKTQIIDLLPWSYKKMVDRKNTEHEVLHVDFLQEWKKLTHAVKGVKWRWLRTQIQQWVTSFKIWEYIFEDEKWRITVSIS